MCTKNFFFLGGGGGDAGRSGCIVFELLNKGHAV